MRLAVILTLGLGVCGPAIINAEKIVFVVPRYIRRSFPGNVMTFYNHNGPVRKMRRFPSWATKRPQFNDHYNMNPSNNDRPFYHGENQPHLTKGSDEYEREFYSPMREVNHVIVPHGKGISHGISFGKGFVSRDHFKAVNHNYEFPDENGNHLNYENQEQREAKEFEDDGYQRLQQSQTQGAGWRFPGNEMGYAQSDYRHELNNEEPRFEFIDDGKNREASSAGSNEERFFPEVTNTEEQRVFSRDNTNSGISDQIHAAPLMMERKLTPIILRDTVDMKEYIEKMQEFVKTWPQIAQNVQNFRWQNQMLNSPASGLQNYQGFHPSWLNGFTRTTGNSYQVQEESNEETNRRSIRQIVV